jgi:putative nucleotidyltransferase with HDIG domain
LKEHIKIRRNAPIQNPVVRTVLYVDDEAALCRAFERALRGPGMRVITTTSAPQAVEILGRESIDVVATDYRMPDLNGLDVLHAARERAPGARRLLVSGRIEGEVDDGVLNDADIDYVLLKPWSLDELRRVVRRAAELAELTRERTQLLQKLAVQEREIVAVRRAQELKLLHCALELRAPDTALHSRRVALVARALGERLGLGGEELQAIEEGALLHDVGKIGLSDALLSKPAPLSAEEWAILCQHPLVGAQLIERSELLPGVATIVRQHHERMDGTGYPHGLCGQEITLAARIVAVADAYEAIRSSRSYRDGRPHDQALDEINRHAGTQFDPRVVEALAALDAGILE